MPDIFAQTRRFQRELLRNERAAASQMARAYGEMYQRVKAQLTALDAQYRAALAAGEKPSWNWLYQYNRLQSFRDQVQAELTRFSALAESTVAAEQRKAIQAGLDNARAIVAADAWNTLDTSAIEAMVGINQAESPLHELFLGVSQTGAQAAEDALLEGMMIGKSPGATARMLKQALGIALSRALTIARTETLRAYRAATRASYEANSDVVTGWIWHAAADERSCGMCWAMHGTEHKLSEELASHPNCRCAMVPIIKGVDFTTSEKFTDLSAEQQIKVLGPAKWAAWKDGQFELSQIVGWRDGGKWGRYRAERSLKSLVGAGDARKYFDMYSSRTAEKGAKQVQS